MFDNLNIIASGGRTVTLTLHLGPVELSPIAQQSEEGYNIKAVLNAGTASEKNPNGNAARQVAQVYNVKDVEAAMPGIIKAVMDAVASFCMIADGGNIHMPPEQGIKQGFGQDDIRRATGIVMANVENDSKRMKPNPAVQQAEEPAATKKPNAAELSQLNHERFLQSTQVIIDGGYLEMAKKTLEYIITAKGDKKKDANALLIMVANKIKMQQVEAEEPEEINDNEERDESEPVEEATSADDDDVWN